MRISAFNDRQLPLALRIFFSALSIAAVRSKSSDKFGIEEEIARISSISLIIESRQY